MSGESKGRKRLLFLMLCLFVLAGFSLASVYSTSSVNAQATASSDDEWKTWQKKYFEEQAAKEKTERKKKAWLEKEPAVIEKVIEMSKLPATAKDIPGMHIKDGKVTEKCLSCHQGVEDISPFHKDYGCTICHRGNGASVVKSEAHKGLLAGGNSGGKLRNPSNLRVLEQSCALGGCHAGHPEEHKNHYTRVRKTMMSLMAGMISGMRYNWAAQPEKISKYAAVGVKDEDGIIPEHRGAMKEIKTIPVFTGKDMPSNKDGSFKTKDDMGNEIEISNEMTDSQWRKSCARCHLWTERTPGGFADSRAQGCAACHVLYDDDGKYKGNDPTISKDKAGHPKVHQLTVAIPAEQCIHCHNRGGRTGVSFEGRIESDFYGTPFKSGALSKLMFHGKYYNTPTKDVHYEKGMECIDCHTQFDVMGDGNIYSKKFEQVEVRCEDCHGNYKEGIKTAKVTDPNDRVIRLGKVSPNYKNKVGDEMVLTARGNKYSNAKIIDGEPILISKFDGREHKMAVIAGKKGAHSIPQHQEKMECYACHARWTSQCYGCHDYYDQTSKSGDWLTGVKTPGGWPEWRSYVRFLEPTLGVNAKGKVATYVPACQIQVNAVTDKGRIVQPYDNFVYKTSEGYSGIVQSPMQTHSIRREVRSCEDCHLSSKALGLGVGDLKIAKDKTGKSDKFEYLYDMKKSGLSPNFPLETIVTPQGQQISSTSHIGARPFNQKEINRILKVGTCLPCHDKYDDPIYKNIQGSYKKADTPKHKKLVQDSLKASKSASIGGKSGMLASKEVAR
ncbi:MAG: hypothetical protein QMD07_01870 [Thermodesulfovibrionales bacterium]|nr:hypothetical protein [Thermodesulfovibrionales bacterium]